MPFVITGAKPNIATKIPHPKTAGKPAPGKSGDGEVPTPGGPATAKAGKSAVKPGSPADPAASPDKAKEKSEAGTAKKTTKPFTLDPKLLERRSRAETRIVRYLRPNNWPVPIHAS